MSESLFVTTVKRALIKYERNENKGLMGSKEKLPFVPEETNNISPIVYRFLPQNYLSIYIVPCSSLSGRVCVLFQLKEPKRKVKSKSDSIQSQ